MALLKDLTGQTFNMLYVEKISHRHGPREKVYYQCTCACGETAVVEGSNLKSGSVKSCGCLLKKSPPNKTHGGREHPLYGVWQNMKNRCYNKNVESYKDYGAIGIDVCESWRNDFQPFFDWAKANNWEKGLEIDRIKNDKGYSPENCRIVTRKVNLANKGKYRNNTTGFVGVSLFMHSTDRYVSSISIDGKQRSLGLFDSIENAVEARNKFITDNALLLKVQDVDATMT